MSFTELKTALSGKDLLEIFNAYGKLLENIVDQITVKDTDDIDYLVKSIDSQKQIYELAEKIYEDLQENVENDDILKSCDELENKFNSLLEMQKNK